MPHEQRSAVIDSSLLVNSVDIVIIIALLIGAERGFGSGFIRQLAGIIGIIFSVLLAVQLMSPLGERITEATAWTSGITSVLAFLLVFILVQVAMIFVARLVERLVGLFQLSILNRVAGAVLGGFKAGLLISVALMVLITFDVPETSSREQSALYDPVASLVPETWEVVAEHLPTVKAISSEFGREVEELIRE